VEAYQLVWNNCLGIVRDNISETAYGTWFTPIVPLKFENQNFTIQVPSQFFFEFLEENYADLICRALARITGQKTKLLYQVVVDSSNNNGKITLQSEHPHNPSEVQKAAQTSNKAPDNLYPPSTQEWDSHLNPQLNFDNFFTGNSNEIARSIAMKMAEDPGKKFNPFFLFGTSGVGKTHLCQAIGNKIVELDPQKKVMYISAHLFETQFTDARRKNDHNDFVYFYQGVDVLILDDIHELAGKEKTQQAYFHIFNHLKLIGKQLILTADRPPVEISGLEERLISRLKWGLTLELQKPDLDLRKKILYHKSTQDGVAISEEIIEYIAENVMEPRDLEGVVSSLLAQSVALNHEIDMELAKVALSRILRVRKPNLTIEGIQSMVSSYFKIEIDQIHSPSRKREVVQARHIIMYLSKKHTNHAHAYIGSLVGNRDHATVIHAIKAVQNSIDTDKSFSSTMKDLESKLLS